jgi:hypothetical protein
MHTNVKAGNTAWFEFDTLHPQGNQRGKQGAKGGAPTFEHLEKAVENLQSVN